MHAAKHLRQFVDVSNRSGRRWAMDPGRDVVFGYEFCCEVVEHGPVRNASEAEQRGLLDAGHPRWH